MYTNTLVKAVINDQHGWAVADQFEDTFNGDPFEDQNYNALSYIHETITDLLGSDLLSDSSNREVQEYLDKLEAYMNGVEENNSGEAG
jgi:hypothetical protein